MTSFGDIQERSQRAGSFGEDPSGKGRPEVNIKEQCVRQNNGPQRYPSSDSRSCNNEQFCGNGGD